MHRQFTDKYRSSDNLYVFLRLKRHPPLPPPFWLRSLTKSLFIILRWSFPAVLRCKLSSEPNLFLLASANDLPEDGNLAVNKDIQSYVIKQNAILHLYSRLEDWVGHTKLGIKILWHILSHQMSVARNILSLLPRRVVLRICEAPNNEAVSLHKHTEIFVYLYFCTFRLSVFVSQL